MLSPIDLLSMVHSFTRLYTKTLASVSEHYQISSIEVDILLFLHNHPANDTARDIVELRYITKSYVSKAVDLLIRKGFLTAIPDSQDRRMLHLKILPAAQNLLGDARKAQAQAIHILSSGISDADLIQMQRTLDKMCSNVKYSLSKEKGTDTTKKGPH